MSRKSQRQLRACLDVVGFASIHMCWGWVRVELELSSIIIHSNTCGSRWIRQYPNKALFVQPGPAACFPIHVSPAVKARERSCEAPGAGGAADRSTRLAGAREWLGSGRTSSKPAARGRGRTDWKQQDYSDKTHGPSWPFATNTILVVWSMLTHTSAAHCSFSTLSKSFLLQSGTFAPVQFVVKHGSTGLISLLVLDRPPVRTQIPNVNKSKTHRSSHKFSALLGSLFASVIVYD